MVGPLAELGAQVVEGGRSQERHRGRKLKLADLVHQRPRDAPVTDVGRIRAPVTSRMCTQSRGSRSEIGCGSRSLTKLRRFAVCSPAFWAVFWPDFRLKPGLRTC